MTGGPSTPKPPPEPDPSPQPVPGREEGEAKKKVRKKRSGREGNILAGQLNRSRNDTNILKTRLG